MKLRSGKAYNDGPRVSRKRKFTGVGERKIEKLPLKQQKKVQARKSAVPASSSSSSGEPPSDDDDDESPSSPSGKLPCSSSDEPYSSAANTPSDVVPNVSSPPTSTGEAPASTSTTVPRNTSPISHQRDESVDQSTQAARPSPFSIYSRSVPTWISLRVNAPTSTQSWYIVSNRRAARRKHSMLGSLSFVSRLPGIPEETSDSESLAIDSERQVRFAGSVTVYPYDIDKDVSKNITNNFYHKGL
ncbi:hypothetical protein MBANPS3_004161 [Mucor bainieri]